MQKTCFKCLLSLDRSEFYAHSEMSDGLLGKCKECTKKDSTKRRNEKIEEVREYDRKRGKEPHRIANVIAQSKKWYKEDKRRQSAHNKAGWAIKTGKIEKLPCCICGSLKSVAHHESYDKPLDITWYCQPHHKDRHKQMVILGIET